MSLFDVGGSAPVPDSAPPTDDYEDLSAVAGVIPLAVSSEDGYDPEAPYGRTKTGRIRKRPVGSTRRTGTAGPRGSNEVLATQAATLLVQVNAFAVTGLMIAGMRQTASEIAGRNDAFEAQVRSALLTDPDLCRTILRAGGASAKVSLLVAYGMLFGSVAPTAVMEYRELRASRED